LRLNDAVGQQQAANGLPSIPQKVVATKKQAQPSNRVIAKSPPPLGRICDDMICSWTENKKIRI